jgi:hypothetical protein
MVKVKVTLVGGETRRFDVPDDVTYDKLKGQIISIFPSLTDSQELKITYRDSDGDIVTVSSNEEISIAISALPSNTTWHLFARVSPANVVRPPVFNPLLLLDSLLKVGLQQQPKEEKKCDDNENKEEIEIIKIDNGDEIKEDKKNLDDKLSGQEPTDDKQTPNKEKELPSSPQPALAAIHVINALPVWSAGSHYRWDHDLFPLHPFVRRPFLQPSFMWF